MFDTIVAYISYYPEISWMVLGGFLLLMEASYFPGIGFLFAGLAALTLGGLMAFEVVVGIDFYTQLTYFFGLTVMWAVLLWYPLRRGLKRRKSKYYSNVVGSIALVGQHGLVKGKTGVVRWSGTNMRARIAQDAVVTTIDAGEEVKIKELEGSTLIVTPLSMPTPTESELASYQDEPLDKEGTTLRQKKRAEEKAKALKDD